ncbi:MAG: hypothetical protein IJ999_04225, partial [Clostridia bacterium]|nr:hypothetical protein [Clostridia bacterium]
ASGTYNAQNHAAEWDMADGVKTSIVGLANVNHAISLSATTVGANVFTYKTNEMQYTGEGAYGNFTGLSLSIKDGETDVLGNYDVTINLSYDITPKQITVTSTDGNGKYNAQAHTLTYLYTDETNEKISVSATTDDSVVKAGGYAFNGAYGSDTYGGFENVALTMVGSGRLANYSISLDLRYTINKATYDMSNAQWNYSNPFVYDDTAKTVKLTGLPDGVTASYATVIKNTTTSVDATNAGTYVTSAELSYDTNNYELIEEEYTCEWQIKQRSLTVTAHPQYSFVQDSEISAYTLILSNSHTSGLVAGHTYEATIAPNASAAGEYDWANDTVVKTDETITASGNNVKANYAITYDLSITIATGLITGDFPAGNISVEYDGEVHSISITTDINVTITYTVDGESVTKPELKNVGTYIVGYTVKADGYNDRVGQTIVTITAKDLTVGFKNISGLVYGEQLPQYTNDNLVITGLVGGDSLGSATFVAKDASNNTYSANDVLPAGTY